MRTKARSCSAAGGAGGASTGGSSRARHPRSGDRAPTARRPSPRGPTCEYPAGPRPAPRAGGGQARPWPPRAVPRTPKVHPPWQSYSGQLGWAVDLGRGLAPLGPALWRDSGDARRRGRGLRPGWSARTSPADGNNGRQTRCPVSRRPLSYNRGCAHRRRWSGGLAESVPWGPPTAPGRSEKGTVCLGPGVQRGATPGT